MLQISVALKNPSPQSGLNPRTLLRCDDGMFMLMCICARDSCFKMCTKNTKVQYYNIPGVLFTMEVYFRSKNSTLQLNAISNYPNTRCVPTLSDVPHKLTFLQSGTLQTQVRAQPLRSSGTNSHSCNQEGSKHTCFSRTNTNSVYQPTGVRSQTHTRRFPNTH
jgi:hypothetical protein